MDIRIVKTPEEGADMAFQLIVEQLKRGAGILGLATGSTPVALYERLVASDLDFSEKISINLDEYVGLGETDEQSYAYFMRQHLFGKKPFAVSYLPDGKAADLQEEVERYGRLVKSHPIDVQILGIGRNGHIGFNEPGTSFCSRVHVVQLDESTIAANARFFDDESQVPRQAISMGIADIMEAKTIVLMAYGRDKAAAIASTVQGVVTELVPASILQEHTNTVVILDEAAASLLD